MQTALETKPFVCLEFGAWILLMGMEGVVICYGSWITPEGVLQSKIYNKFWEVKNGEDHRRNK